MSSSSLTSDCTSAVRCAHASARPVATERVQGPLLVVRRPPVQKLPLLLLARLESSRIGKMSKVFVGSSGVLRPVPTPSLDVLNDHEAVLADQPPSGCSDVMSVQPACRLVPLIRWGLSTYRCTRLGLFDPTAQPGCPCGSDSLPRMSLCDAGSLNRRSSSRRGS